MCATEATKPERVTQCDQHPTKKLRSGKARWPVDGITHEHMVAVFVIVFTMGLVRLPEMTHRWCTSDLDNFTLVRHMVSRDSFLLICGRMGRSETTETRFSITGDGLSLCCCRRIVFIEHTAGR